MNKTLQNTYFNSISQFKFLDRSRLGKGSFGEVKLALHLQTNKLYAIKIIEVKQITTPVGFRALEKEIEFHMRVNHPHIIKLWQVLQEDSKIFMIMENAEKGNLFYYQNETKKFSQENSSVFFSQTLSALQYLHSLNFIHRDIKPQNLLIDKDLNVKVCDLGWVTEGIDEMHSTFCGTYEYMAPQMIFQRQYDHKIDIWALGVLLYQLLHGCAPFQGQRLQDVKAAMIQGEIFIDPHLSQNAQNLIFNILKVNPDQRLSLKQIKAHPWITDMKKRKLLDISSFLFTNKNQIEKNEFSIKKQRKANNSIRINSYKKSEGIKKLGQKKELIVIKQKKNMKNVKMNTSSQNVLNRKQNRQKQIQKLKNNEKRQMQKLFKQKESKKVLIGHKSQKSDISQIKLQRLKTELNEGKTMKYQVVRFNTEVGEGFESVGQRSTIKKKNAACKKLQMGSTINVTKSECKQKFIRKSID